MVVVKTLTTAGSVLALGYSAPVAAASALTLAQVGEFSFVLDRAGQAVGLSPAGLGDTGSQAFIASTVVLMVATPQLTALGSSLAQKLKRRHVRAASAAAIDARPDVTVETFAHLQHHVIVAGYGEAARQLVRVLHGSRVPFIITTLSPGGANEAEAQGLPVLRGDSGRRHTLELAGIDRAKAVVVADDDPATAQRIVAVARSLAPTARIVVRTRYPADAAALLREGADHVVVEELESVVQLFADVLRNYRISPQEIEAHEEAIRSGGYAALRELSGEPVVVCNLDGHCLDTRTVVIREGAPLVGQSLDSLTSIADLEVTAVTRDQRRSISTDRCSSSPETSSRWPDPLRRSQRRRHCSGRPDRSPPNRFGRRRHARTSRSTASSPSRRIHRGSARTSIGSCRCIRARAGAKSACAAATVGCTCASA